jgi:hypothetical protein
LAKTKILIFKNFTMTQIIPTEKNFLLYTTPDGEIKVNVLLQNETIWLSQKSMSSLFDCTPENILLHLKNIYETGELREKATTKDFLVVQIEGNRNVKRTVKHYNLDAIISVGYRVNSLRGTQFRIWATQQLKEFVIKGFVMDDERLKNPNNPFGQDYFEQVEERVRDIRSSERRFYQKITDIYATSIDYNKDAEITKNFFATVQNKMHFGIHGKTAAEVIAERADSTKPNMGITCISEKKLKKSDIFVGKNYLTKDEISELNLIVEQYLAFAKLQAQKRIAMTMKDWIEKLDDFLRLNEKEILAHKGSITKKLADEKAEVEFVKFKKKQMALYESDFDKAVQQYLETGSQ